MPKEATRELGHFVVIKFTKFGDAEAAISLLQEQFPGEKVWATHEWKTPVITDDNIAERRFTKLLLGKMREHPNRCWEREDLRIFAEEHLYSASSVNHYIQSLVRTDVLKVLKTGGILLVKKEDDAAPSV